MIRHSSGAFYIGASRNLARRRREHFRAIGAAKGDCRGLVEFARSISRDPTEYTFAPLLLCAPEHLVMYEDRALNVLYGTDGCLNTMAAGNVATDETRRRQSVAVAGERHPQFGKALTPETRAKISATLTGRIVPPEHCASISASKVGKKLSLEHCAAITRGKTGKHRKPFTVEHLAKLRVARAAQGAARKGKPTGRSPSQETRDKQRATWAAKRQRTQAGL